MVLGLPTTPASRAAWGCDCRRGPDQGEPDYYSGMLLALLLQSQALGPESCILTGLCPAATSGSPIPSGVMFTAVGLVAFGIWQWRERRPGDT